MVAARTGNCAIPLVVAQHHRVHADRVLYRQLHQAAMGGVDQTALELIAAIQQQYDAAVRYRRSAYRPPCRSGSARQRPYAGYESR